jgi:lipopolysaccharide export system permease protein
MVIKLYQKYLIINYLKILLEVTGVFFALIFIMGLLEEISFFKELDEGVFYPIVLTLLNLPSVLYDIFPFIFIITTQFFFIKMVDKSELSIFKTSGISNLNIIGLLVITSFILALLINIVFYNVSSKLKHQYLSLKNNFSLDNKYLAVITENGLWIKDETAQKISIINSSRLIENFIENVEITEFDKNFELLRTIFVEKVDISEVNWVMKRAKISINNKTTYPEYDLIYKTNFNSEKLNSYFSNLKSLSFFELYNAKRNYKKLGYSTNDLEIHLLKFYTYPFYLTIMTLFSCVIMMNIKHNKPKIFHIILGIMVSVIIYYINLFSNILGQSLDISNKISNMLPIVIICLSCCIGMLKINEK